VVEQTNRVGKRPYDIYSRLLKDRIVMLARRSTTMWLTPSSPSSSSESEDPSDISLYINSPGGVVTSGLAIYDTISSS